MFEEGQEILDKRYRVIKKLGGGAFGEIFKGKFLAQFCTKEARVASALFERNFDTKRQFIWILSRQNRVQKVSLLTEFLCAFCSGEKKNWRTFSSESGKFKEPNQTWKELNASRASLVSIVELWVSEETCSLVTDWVKSRFKFDLVALLTLHDCSLIL